MRETMKIILIVGPESGDSPAESLLYKEILGKNFVGVFSIYDLFTALHKMPDEYRKHLCGIFLRTTASAILALPEWEKSEIAKDAVAYAKHYPSMEVFYPKLPTIDDRELRKAIGWGRAPWLMTVKK